MGNEWQIGLLIVVVAVFFAYFYFKNSKPNGCFGKLFNLLIAVWCLLAVFLGAMFIFDDASTDIGDGYDYDYEPETEYYDEESSSSGSNVNFKGSYNDKYKGNPCKHKDIGDAQTCGERGDCYGGFDSQNWDASKCINCRHSYKDHK